MSLDIYRHKEFDKQFSKLTKKQKIQVLDRLAIFIDDPLNPLLRNHALVAQWKGHRSISIAGDLRLHYREMSDKAALLVAIGTHSSLYR